MQYDITKLAPTAVQAAETRLAKIKAIGGAVVALARLAENGFRLQTVNSFTDANGIRHTRKLNGDEALLSLAAPTFDAYLAASGQGFSFTVRRDLDGTTVRDRSKAVSLDAILDEK